MAQETHDFLLETPSPLRMTFEEFLEWGEEGTFAEWVNGEVIIMGNPSGAHQNLLGFLAALFRHFVEAYDLGVVFSAPFLMKVNPSSGREPDLIYLSKKGLSRLLNNYIDGPADLVIEIESPDSVIQDRRDKRREYELGGVREYWILGQEGVDNEFYFLDEDGRFQPIPVIDGVIHSVVLEGLWMRAEWLRQETRPPLMSVLKEWRLV